VPVFTMQIGGTQFKDLNSDGERFALYGIEDAPEYAYQESAASGRDGKELYDHGFRGLFIYPEVAYIGDTALEDMNEDSGVWGGSELTIVIDGTQYQYCVLRGKEILEKYPGLIIVRYTFEKHKPND
jgi:hypothetical protein